MLQIMKREWKKMHGSESECGSLSRHSGTGSSGGSSGGNTGSQSMGRWGRWGWKWKWPAAAAAATMMLSSWHIVSMSDGASSPSRHFGRGQGKSINDGQQCKCFYSCHSEAVMH